MYVATITHQLYLFMQVLLAFVLGAVIGWEREFHQVAAGIRTFGAIAMGSCVFGLISLHSPETADPSRIAAQVVMGVGFIGAGIFFRQGDYVTGLTTAATLWCTASIGLAIAFGLYSVGVLTTLVMLLFLFLSRMPWWSRISGKRRRLSSKAKRGQQ